MAKNTFLNLLKEFIKNTILYTVFELIMNLSLWSTSIP
jgi:hypothetical protein